MRKQTLFSHLRELFYRVRVCLLALILSSLIFLPLSPTLLKILKESFLPEGWEIIVTSPLEALMVEIKVSVMFGAIVSFPLFLYHFLKFLLPALFKKERKVFLDFLIGFLILFLTGAFFSYFFILPLTYRILSFFINSTQAKPLITLENFFNFSIFFIFSSALVFTFPIPLLILSKIGIVSSKLLKKNRKYFLGSFLIILTFLTPDPTIITDLLLFLPILFLYELSIILMQRFERCS